MLFRSLANGLLAIKNCEKSKNLVWLKNHTEEVKRLVSEHMPRGAGFDDGTKLDFTRSTPEKLVFLTLFHHMHDMGTYDGWTEHTVTVRPSLVFRFTLTISGRNRDNIKDVIHESFEFALSTVIDEQGKAVA